MRVKMNTIKNRMNVARGFTILELLIVVAILGVVYAAYKGLAGSGATAQANAQQKYMVATKGTMLWSTIVASTNVPTNPATNVLFQGSNDALDVLVGGDLAVASTYDNAYRLSGATTIGDSFQIATQPTAGTKGSYRLGSPNTVVTIANGASSREVNWVFTAVAPEEVEYLVTKYDPSSTFNASTADTTGPIRYSAPSNGVHTLTIVTQVK